MKVSELNAWNGLDEAIDRALAQTETSDCPFEEVRPGRESRTE